MILHYYCLYQSKPVLFYSGKMSTFFKGPGLSDQAIQIFCTYINIFLGRTSTHGEAQVGFGLIQAYRAKPGDSQG